MRPPGPPDPPQAGGPALPHPEDHHSLRTLISWALRVGCPGSAPAAGRPLPVLTTVIASAQGHPGSRRRPRSLVPVETQQPSRMLCRPGRQPLAGAALFPPREPPRPPQTQPQHPHCHCFRFEMATFLLGETSEVGESVSFLHCQAPGLEAPLQSGPGPRSPAPSARAQPPGPMAPRSPAPSSPWLLPRSSCCGLVRAEPRLTSHLGVLAHLSATGPREDRGGPQDPFPHRARTSMSNCRQRRPLPPFNASKPRFF